VGKQIIEDTGPLTTERMETIDEEILAGALDFMQRSREANQPFFLWFCPTRMHIWTHLKPETEGMTGLGPQADGMVELDGYVGRILDALEEQGIAENTIVVFATDNGAQVFSWPDGNMTPFKGEKNSNWEGAYRIPMMVRWPGQISPGTVSNGIVSLQDWVPTLMTAAGVPEIKPRLLAGYESGDKTFTAHLDGYDLLGHLVNGEESPRDEFFYFNDDGDLVGLRSGRWKFILRQQNAKGLDVWFEPMDELRRPRLVDLRADPFERAIEESENYDIWMLERVFVMYPLQDIVREFLRTFVAFPPRNAEERVERIQAMIEQLDMPTP
ncbi:MAG TPA: sulfatase-like hydrolase/transferase, partial [Thermomicrobiales bacterium]|nr:sulfatase-like hydrolase/transferase [Thermomicrobiales bacterium]